MPPRYVVRIQGAREQMQAVGAHPRVSEGG